MAQADEDANQPILYMNPGSFFSEIALLSLHEKQVKYTPRFVNLQKMENLSPWFLNLNPKAQVPVLQDEGKTIAGSDMIILHLEEKYGHGMTSNLEKVKHFDELFRTKIRNAVLTFGVILHPEISSGVKIPEYEQTRRIAMLKNMNEHLDQAENMHKVIPEIVKQKRKMFEFFNQMLANKEEVRKEITSLRAILENVEEELASHEHKDWWLCSDHFSTADAYLGVLLNRLDMLGLSSSLQQPNILYNLIRYKERLEECPWFQAFLADVKLLHHNVQASISK